MNGFFITGTDTGVGKTTIATQLLNQYNQAGMRTLGLKPVASGCEQTVEGLRNSDALALQNASSIKLPYTTINPFAFAPAIAPHLAAQAVGVCLSAKSIAQHCLDTAKQHQPDQLIIEGAGGWCVPLNQQESFADLAVMCGLPVILVVAIRLGCINHALLSWQGIQSSGLAVAGWVANCMEADMPMMQENIETITEWLGVEPLMRVGVIEGAI